MSVVSNCYPGGAYLGIWCCTGWLRLQMEVWAKVPSTACLRARLWPFLGELGCTRHIQKQERCVEKSTETPEAPDGLKMGY